MKSRQQYLQWCKIRALKYIDDNDFSHAFVSMCLDLNSNSETRNHPAIDIGTKLIMSGYLSTKTDMKNFIEGFK